MYSVAHTHALLGFSSIRSLRKSDALAALALPCWLLAKMKTEMALEERESVVMGRRRETGETKCGLAIHNMSFLGTLGAERGGEREVAEVSQGATKTDLHTLNL